MKGIFKYLRLALAGAVLLAVAACGGGSVTNVAMSGTITGLSSGSLTLTNGLSTAIVQAGATTFTFPGRITVGSTFQVAVVTQPALLACSLANNTGIAGTTDIDFIVVTCATNNLLGGTVTGLKNSGLVLANGSDNAVIAAGATTFNFPTKIISGTAYGATILTQPAGQTCTVKNGVGTMGETNITSIQVSCI